MTVYVEREGGVVVGLYANPQSGRAEEALADDHPDVVAYLDPPSQVLEARAAAVQAHVDAVAAQRGYGNGAMLASYVASTVPQWTAEAAAFVSWRDAVWLACYAILAAVQAGQRAAPSIEDLVAELPPIQWPT